MKKPLISIVTINRNNASGLKKTMESVLTQDFSDYEYIVIDGDSTDGSVDVVRQLLETENGKKHISYWVSEKDTGIYNAMNKGIRHAKGEFIALVNSGDSYVNGILKDVAEIAKKHENEILYGANSTYKNGKFVSVYGYSFDKIPEGFMIAHLTSFVPSSVYEKYGLYDESFKIAGDFDLFNKFYVNKVPSFYMNKIICDFDLDGISNTNPLVFEEVEKVQRKYGFYVEPTRKQKIKKSIKKVLKKIFFFL